MFTVQGLMIWGNAVSTEKKESTSEIHGGTAPIVGAYKKKWGPQTTAKLVYKSNNFGL